VKDKFSSERARAYSAADIRFNRSPEANRLGYEYTRVHIYNSVYDVSTTNTRVHGTTIVRKTTRSSFFVLVRFSPRCSRPKTTYRVEKRAKVPGPGVLVVITFDERSVEKYRISAKTDSRFYVRAKDIILRIYRHTHTHTVSPSAHARVIPVNERICMYAVCIINVI